LEIYAEREWVREGKMRYFRDTEGQKAEFDEYMRIFNEKREKKWKEEHEKKSNPQKSTAADEQNQTESKESKDQNQPPNSTQ